MITPRDAADEIFAREQRKNPEVHEEGGAIMADKSYAGKIAQTGSQVVKAPAQISPKKGKSTVKTGDDLRTGKGR